MTEAERGPVTAVVWGAEAAVAAVARQARARGVRVGAGAAEGAEGAARLAALAGGAEVGLLCWTAALGAAAGWQEAVAAALRRQAADPTFALIVLGPGATPAAVATALRVAGLGALADGALLLPAGALNDETAALDGAATAAGEVLRRGLAARWARLGAGRAYVPTLCLRTFAYTPPDPLDLDLDWTAQFPADSYSGQDWEALLLPALRDVRDALQSSPVAHRLRLWVKARLPAALAGGWAFMLPTGWEVQACADGGIAWSSDGPAAPPAPLQCDPVPAAGDPAMAVVELAVSSATATQTAQTLTAYALQPGTHLRFTPLDGPGRNAVPDGATARAMVAQLAAALTGLRGRGMRHLHLFAALPAPLAVLVGRHLNALLPLTFYVLPDQDGPYQPAHTFGGHAPAADPVPRVGPPPAGGPATPELRLTGAQARQLQEALLAAFPRTSAMARMVRFGLNQTFAVIAGGDTLADQVFSLIEWAEAHGQEAQLLQVALAANAGNPQLRTLAQQLLPHYPPA